jgi:hypothetical protein
MDRSIRNVSLSLLKVCIKAACIQIPNTPPSPPKKTTKKNNNKTTSTTPKQLVIATYLEIPT